MAEVPDTVDDAIGELSDTPTTDEVFFKTLPFQGREIASAAVSMAAVGGGGSLPDNWTVDTTTDPNGRTLRYKVNAGPESGVFQLQLGSDANTGFVATVTDTGNGVSTAVQAESVGPDGVSLISAFNNDGGTAQLDSRGGLSLFTVADFKAIDAWDFEGNFLRFALLPTAGHIMTAVTTATPDGDLSAGQVSFWFDDTDGAAKLKIRGKSANGTVVVGEVALT